MDKKIIKDPFLGEIELTKRGQTNMSLMGELRVDTIYTDVRGNYWIDTWATTGGDPIPMMFIRKELIDMIIDIHG